MTGVVLIVDDSLTVRMDLAEAFNAAGFRTRLCKTAAEARAELGGGLFDAVVLDVILPDGDGVELLREVRSSASAAAVVLMLSSEAEVKDRIRGIETGADEYVGKPYDPGFVIARTQELVRMRRSRTSGRPVILLIDDSPTFREALREALEDAGYDVLLAASGEEGLRIAGGQRPNAIVVDGILPGIDGATVIRRIRLDAALRGVPCLLLTASGERSAELDALDAGADAFVRKEEDLTVILARIAATLRVVQPGAPRETASLLGSKRILAVDDSITYLQELSAMLRGEGYDVVLARSGEEALELLSVQSVDCILLDRLMPGLGGEATCRRIKSAPVVRNIPLIMLTSLDDRVAMIEGLSFGADDYISKSSEFDVLKARLRAQLRRKQFEDENRRIRDELLHKELEAAQARATRELAETRAVLVEELERRNKELEAFSYSVSHDLRAPLRSIDGFSLALLEDYGPALDVQGQDYLKRVRSAAQRMADLIDDLLELSRVTRVELRREPMDLSEVAANVVAELRRREPERSVEVRIQAGMPIEGDRRLLRIVLENLLGNAWKFTSKVPAARIDFATSESPDGRQYRIQDNGAGFEMAYAEKLFRPFQRLHSEEDFPGTGIGLATVQRIIDRHGGRVWAEGAVGDGAKFLFTLPHKNGEST